MVGFVVGVGFVVSFARFGGCTSLICEHFEIVESLLVSGRVNADNVFTLDENQIDWNFWEYFGLTEAKTL